MNNVVLIGRLTKDPELRYIANSGTATSTFTLAIDRYYKNKDGSVTTDFIPVEIMGNSAEYTANYIRKGYLVSVLGSIRVDKYQTQNGENRTFTKVFARQINNLQSKNSSTTSDNTGIVNEAPPTFSAVDDEDVPF